MQAFTDPVFGFIEEAISNGQNILVHCLAGAHRAGTTGVACLIHFAGLNVEEAIVIAKRCRPIIDPIGQLPEFLFRLKRLEESRETSSAPASIKTSNHDK
jgi:protein-tyrosine phosphatase